jgi:cytochrome c oxidase subunit II
MSVKRDLTALKKRLVILSIIAAALSIVGIFVFLRFDFIPSPASAERQTIDSLAKITFAIASVVFSVVLVVFLDSILFFRRRPGDNSEGPGIRNYASLERGWTLIPLAMVIGIAIYAAFTLEKITAAAVPATRELQVEVTAARFSWQFYYPEFNITSNDLELPVNQRVHFSMQSKDVVHSFWVQEFGPKQDIVPGMTTELRITPTKPGNYIVQCSQLCGYGHTNMLAPVHVVSSADFQKWAQQQKQAPAPPPTSAPAKPSTNVNLVAQNIAFDTNNIIVSAGATITINFNNKDTGVPHNFAVYTDSSATTVIFRGNNITGPNTTTYTFKAPSKPGKYFFRCDVHPTQMTGTLEVR